MGSFLKNMEQQSANDPNFLASLTEIVRGIERDHSAATGDEKWALAFQAGVKLAEAHGKQITTSLLNTLIEVSVQKIKSAGIVA